ncbi:hypothetical protein [Streptomyces sp. NPDC101455]|uniref:hypothetical protein n=1 Tax=Streptomyces sp. NPDC101455 TaxID=3366142 RepID=UPI0037F53397
MPAHQYRNVILPFTFLRRMDCLRRHEVDLGLKVAATEGEGGVAAASSDSAQAGPDRTRQPELRTLGTASADYSRRLTRRHRMPRSCSPKHWSALRECSPPRSWKYWTRFNSPLR